VLDPLSVHDAADSISEKKTAAWLSENPDEHPDVVRMLRFYPKTIDLSVFGLERVAPNAKFDIGEDSQFRTSAIIHPSVDNVSPMWTVRDLISALISTYCGNVGVEYIHISNYNQRKWLEKKIEGQYGPLRWSGRTPEVRRKDKDHFLSIDFDVDL
jgi:hypothetical protein